MTVAILLVAYLAAAHFIGELKPASLSSEGETRNFEVKSGEGFRVIVGRLADEGIIKSKISFGILSVLTGSATKFKPGLYGFNGSVSGIDVLRELVKGSHREVTVTIPDGVPVYDIERILKGAGISSAGGFGDYVLSHSLEGRLFPDTYRFFVDSDAETVLKKFTDNFNSLALPILEADSSHIESNLILASLVEKEVPGLDDRKLVAGILKKRLANGVPLQVDATVCYIKAFINPGDGRRCYPLSPLDFKLDSPYNTYLYKGLPPGPIGNPGISAIEAVLNYEKSPYWYYLSDPKTGKTVFSRTLDEQEENRVKYLRR